MARSRTPVPPETPPPAPRPRAPRTYDALRDQVLTLHAAGETPSAIARATGLRLREVGLMVKAADKDVLEDACTDMAMRAADAVTDEKLAKASARDAAIIYGIATDKRAVLRGEPTAILWHTHEAAGALDRLCEAIVSERERRALNAQTITVSPGGGT